MTSGGHAYELPTWEPPIGVTGGSDSPLRLLPTPCARLHGKNARPLNEVVLLFPTPTASDGKGGPGTTPKRAGGMNLRTLVTTLPDSGLAQDWADFEPAIRRQEALSGREAPIPTELGPKGGRRLTARFAEWLMWIPDGWVTAVPGLTRSQQLQRIGNGAVPDQAEAAYAYLLSRLPQAVPAHQERSARV
jgi:DNA (cytosine-5)-methyltransferase 1